MNYIKTPGAFSSEYALSNSAPRFRKTFNLKTPITRATVRCAGLGFGYFYINGKRISEDLFTAPVSDYRKTVWYNEYDVTHLLRPGTNVICAILGNGFYNESFRSLFRANEAPWRDKPKLLLSLTAICGDETYDIESDATWRCTDNSPITYNMLRSGEYYDARLYEHGWNDIGFDDSAWDFAVVDDAPPTGVLRKCECEPIRECEEFLPEEIRLLSDGRYLFKFPRCISGYAAIDTAALKNGQKLVIRYSECIKDDGSPDFKNAEDELFYPESRYAWDELIASNDPFVWKPRFAYHGFRYIIVDGFDSAPSHDTVKAIFVHQTVAKKTSFICSDARLNRLFDMGINSSLSNMFYMPTDCPSREKLGWTNDAQASADQFLTNFHSEKLMQKWFRDVLDSMRDDGAIPAVIPSGGYGFTWGHGPTSTGILFELPYQLYRHSGDAQLLTEALPAFLKHLEYIKANADDRGLIDYGLCDWNGTWANMQDSPTPRACSSTLLYIKFLKICELAARFAQNREAEEYAAAESARMTQLFKDIYFTADGRMSVNEQCGLALAVVLDVYTDFSVIAEQLAECVARDNYHITCGMLGVRYLFRALDKTGKPDLSLKMICAEGEPGYMHWIDALDATAMLETWSGIKSHNHHMYSDVMTWLSGTLGGVKFEISDGEKVFIINPFYAGGISHCRVCTQTAKGELDVHWQKTDRGTALTVSVPKNTRVLYKNNILKSGVNKFIC